mmetsp:Transcript_53240/g.155041  ORF Transcript_53240/g.155041 Transcript_53240/m.155041 type:complete len:223 (+) Transcript_53240:1061-1729(+)
MPNRPSKRLLPGKLRHVREARQACCKDNVRWAQHKGLAIADHLYFPALPAAVEACMLALGSAPVVDVHHLRVELDPVSEHILGGEHGPMIRKRDVREVVVPDGVVKAERLVTVPPVVARPVPLVDHYVWHLQTPQPSAQRDASLTTPDDQDIGLFLQAHRGRFVLLSLKPGGVWALVCCTMPSLWHSKAAWYNAVGSRVVPPGLLLKATELLRCRHASQCLS